jgi:hypothetical protein
VCAEELLCDSDLVFHMLPITTAGVVEFSEQEDGQTLVELKFDHPMPDLLLQLHIGPWGVQNHMEQILKENLEVSS